MEKNIALKESRRSAWSLGVSVQKFIMKPVAWLQKYYSDVLERELSVRQTWLLINAQLAFIFAVFPVDGPLLARLACGAWLISALLKCKAEL